MASMIFYKRPELLQPTAHKDLKFTPLESFKFAKEATSVPLMAVEFTRACMRFPIVFSQNDKEEIQSHAVLSLEQGGNSFVSEEGQWMAPYLPVFIRRYPFVLANLAENPKEFAVAFDAESGCFNKEEGQALFNEDAKPTDFLQRQMEYLRQTHQAHLQTLQFLKLLKEEGLLSPIRIDIFRGEDKKKLSIRNLMAVQEPKLKELAAEKAHRFVADGFMPIICAHLISLNNLDRVADRDTTSTDTVPWRPPARRPAPQPASTK